MYHALDTNGECISAEDAEKKRGTPPYHCEECTVELIPVREFVRRSKYAKKTVAAFYRLPPDTGHDEGCVHNVRGQLETLTKKHGTKYLKRLPDGTYVLQLVVPGARARMDGQPLTQSRSSASDPRLGDRELLDYLNSAMGVLEVQSKLMADVDMREHLRLLLGSEPVDWEDFFYDRADHLRCFEYVRSKKGEYPIAVLGTVQEREIVESRKYRRKLALLSLVKPVPHPRPTQKAGVLESFELSMWSRSLGEFNSFHPGDPIMMFGYWTAESEKNPNTNPSRNARFYLNHQLHFWPLVRSQFCIAKPLHVRRAAR